jgi:hemerythrin
LIDLKATPHLSWHDGMLLGHPAIDSDHEEFVRLILALEQVADEGVAATLEALAEHAIAHFELEERHMDQTRFPARECHAAEHRAVLSSVAGVRARVLKGDLAPARALANALADWFPGHAEYLDAALSHLLCKQHHGGKPVVLRRHQPAKAMPPAGRHEHHLTTGRH